ncbi:Myotubularin-related protein 3 [Orchesella cincta]|uniref:Lateral signaling target protein 2 homolog n=1 Tax=Orchesella cincta TaxID=48709 RepID=A0A1D2N5C0_ORCCI|nr:Myotubularin-related protein 3 [Orchesella cincta]
MTNSEDTTAADNLSTINSASKVTDSSYSSNGAYHQNQLGGNSQKESCVVDHVSSNGTGNGVWNGTSEMNGDITHSHRIDDNTSRSTMVSTLLDTNIKASSLHQPSLPTLPFRLICGETLELKCDTTEGVLALTNYRLFIQGKDTNFNIPIGVIEQVENRDIFFLHVSGKDARCIRCTFPNNETATETMKRIQAAIGSLKRIEDTFAYTFFQKSQDDTLEDVKSQLGLELDPFPSAKERFDMEIKRMEFNVQGPWRISDENKDYDLCNSYPTHIIVPSNMTKKQLEQVACFRSARRFPAVVWRHRGNGAVISRCSQPEVGWFGWRSAEDEELVQNIVIACADNSKMTSHASETTMKPERIRIEDSDDNSSNDTHNGSLLSMELVPEQPNVKKLLILDARSYTTAVANRARGGGCECLEYYPRCEIQFMNLANIHSIRKSFMNVRQLCTMGADQSNSWYSQLESCKWLQHMSGLMKAAVTVVTAIEVEGRPVMVHCSDGWDRTPQIVALAEILLDPYYRSLEGFQVLVEREWLDFGHKFADRCGQPVGSEDANERCPVFLQWLDCLHQLIRQFPTAFEFNLTYLVKLAQHTYSNLFGTFICNTAKERQACGLERLTHSVWRFLRAPANAQKFRNNLYLYCDKVLWPSCEVRDLVLWSQVYLGYENPPSQTAEILNPSQESSPAPSVAADCEMNDRMNACKTLNKNKTRSCEDLHLPNPGGLQRRQSDPNLSDSFHAGDSSCDIEDDYDDAVPLKTSTPMTRSPTKINNFIDQNISGYSADDSSTGINQLNDFEDSENDDTEPNSESKSESTVISIAKLDPKSIESSTDTLVPDTIGLPDTAESAKIRNERIMKTDLTKTRESSCIGQRGKTDCVVSTAGIMPESSVVSKRKPEGVEPVSKQYTSNNILPEDVIARSKPKSDKVINEPLLSEMENGALPEQGPSLHCEVCATSRKLLRETYLSSSVHGNVNSANNHFTASTSVISPSNGIIVTGSGSASKFSSYNTPMHSRTPSTGIPATPDENGTLCRLDRQGLQDITLGASYTSIKSAFDVDGLLSLHDEVQNRLNMIVSGYKGQIEILQRELQLTRDALMKQVCHKCTHHMSERPDDVASVGDSLASGEHQSVGHESQSSEISWEAVDEKDTRPPLWLPDYAVTNCMGCEASFWLGRRKHHCRSCGKIFCADCSDQTITIPSEQFFTPVRVCTVCFQRLASHSSENVPGPVSSIPNGNHASNTDEPSLQTNSHSRNVQYANQNGCDHSKAGCSHSSSNAHSCACTTTVPSSKGLNHSSKEVEPSLHRQPSHSNGLPSESCCGVEEKSKFVQCYVNQTNLPRNSSSKLPSPNDITTHHHATTKQD